MRKRPRKAPKGETAAGKRPVPSGQDLGLGPGQAPAQPAGPARSRWGRRVPLGAAMEGRPGSPARPGLAIQAGVTCLRATLQEASLPGPW